VNPADGVNTATRVLVTRPEPQAGQWANDLQRVGFAALPLPLIEIAGPADPAPVQALWEDMAAQRALMFVSPAAVEWFFRLRPQGAHWAPDTLAAAPGPGTARALQTAGAAHGLRPEQLVCPGPDAAQFDSEALWPLLAPLDWQGQRIGIVSGGDDKETKGRTWLAEQWRAKGASVTPVLTYQRRPGAWALAQQTLATQALTLPEAHIWLLSSSQAIDFLAGHHAPALPISGAPSPDWSRLRALVTHPKIADRARALGVRRITQARPTLDAVAQALRTAA